MLMLNNEHVWCRALLGILVLGAAVVMWRTTVAIRSVAIWYLTTTSALRKFRINTSSRHVRECSDMMSASYHHSKNRSYFFCFGNMVVALTKTCHILSRHS